MVATAPPMKICSKLDKKCLSTDCPIDNCSPGVNSNDILMPSSEYLFLKSSYVRQPPSISLAFRSLIISDSILPSKYLDTNGQSLSISVNRRSDGPLPVANSYKRTPTVFSALVLNIFCLPSSSSVSTSGHNDRA